MKRFVSIFLIVFGIACLLSPDIKTFLQDKETRDYIEEFQDTYQEMAGKQADGTEDGGSPGEDGTQGWQKKEDDPLYQEIQSYNRKVHESGQLSFPDAWEYKQLPISLEHLADEKFGYIEIPAMGQTLALYLGATDENLSHGVAVLGETSIPIGGTDTNAVIAGHRGYNGIPFFKEIEKLSPGDAVYITNPWGKMAYRVESIDIVQPNNADSVKVQSGRDMVTLVTCHPYRSHGKYRYLVYCVRDDSLLENPPATTEESPRSVVTVSDGTTYELSGNDIRTEALLRRAASVFMAAGIALSVIISACRKRKVGRGRERNWEPPIHSI